MVWLARAAQLNAGGFPALNAWQRGANALDKGNLTQRKYHGMVSCPSEERGKENPFDRDTWRLLWHRPASERTEG